MPISWPTRGVLAIGAILGATAIAAPQTSPQSIDVQRSKLTVYVYKSGMFSAFADNHVISAPIARGTMTTAPSPAVEITVHAADLLPLDPNLDRSKRAEVRTRMLGVDVLDTAKFPTIEFKSTSVVAVGTDRWTASGRLTIHGVTRDVSFPVTKSGGLYRGETRILQRDFGITPIRIAGGTVSVKDEIRIEFEVVEEQR